MNYLKWLFKIIIGIIGVSILCLILMLSGESYEIVGSSLNNKLVNVEIKKFYGKKISECAIDSFGLYHGAATTWHLFSKTIRNDGVYNKGYWHGRWKEYDRSGNLIMIRAYDMGKLTSLFLPEGNAIKEVPIENWPKSANVNQLKLQRINGK